MTIREVVLINLRGIIEEYSPAPLLDELSDDMLLEDLYLDSVAFATLISRIEAEIDFVPYALFSGQEAQTVGQFVSMYEAQKESQ